MPITIPSASNIRVTTGVRDQDDYLPGVAGAALTPGPVVVSAAGPNAAGQPTVVMAQEGQSAKGGENYYAFNLASKDAGQPASLVRKCSIDGLAGMTPGLPVYIDTTLAGLTHTKTTGIARIGVAQTATRLRLD